jgi:hypothetical protein
MIASRTLVFADIAAYTALTEAHGEADAGRARRHVRRRNLRQRARQRRRGDQDRPSPRKRSARRRRVGCCCIRPEGVPHSMGNTSGGVMRE